MSRSVRVSRVSIASIFLAGVASMGVAPSLADSSYYFRYKAPVIGENGSGSPVDESLSISLQVSSPFGLTVGEAVSMPLHAEGLANDVTYRVASTAFMPGLSVNPSTGAVSGSPSGAEGASYVIAVEAIRDDEVVAVSAPVERVLRAPLEVTDVPEGLALIIGEAFPLTGIGAQASGGNPDSVTWSLENAPSWLELVSVSDARQAVLRVKTGMSVTKTSPRTVEVIARDNEGREARGATFTLEVLPPIEKLLASDGMADDYFGYSASVSSDGTTALVGNLQSSGNGAAYVYVKSGSSWTQQAKLTAAEGALQDYFGISVSLSGDGNTALIGAYFDDDKGTNSGSAYVFTRAGGTWTQQAKLVASDGAASDAFGKAVSLSSDGLTALVGSYRDDDRGNNSGSSYVFSRSGAAWTQQAKLVPTDGVARAEFGASVAISANGSVALIGAPGDDDLGADSGSAYIYALSGGTWSQQAKITAADGAAGDELGSHVALSSDGSTAVVGAPFDDDKGTDSGSAYVFVQSGGSWLQEAKLVAPDGKAGDHFGLSMAISAASNTILIGTPDSNVYGDRSGSAYLFSKNGGAWSMSKRIVPYDGTTNDRFGFQVTLPSDASMAIVTAYQDDDIGSDSGSVYVVPLQ